MLSSQVSTPVIVSNFCFWKTDFLLTSRLFESVYCLGFRLIFDGWKVIPGQRGAKGESVNGVLLYILRPGAFRGARAFGKTYSLSITVIDRDESSLESLFSEAVAGRFLSAPGNSR